MTKQQQKIIEEIARKELFIETLDERGNDSLDFHDCGVLSIKAALSTAFEAGKRAALKSKQGGAR